MKTTFEMAGGRGYGLFAQAWEPAAPARRAVGIVHGLGDHCGRYAHVAAKLAAAGIGVVAFDQRGHGKSGGNRGHVPDYHWMLDDIDQLVTQLQTRFAAAPVFLYGHSLGGNLVVNYLLRRRAAIDGAVVMSPLLLPASPPATWKRTAARLLNRVWPSFSFGTGVTAEQLSHDPEAIAAHDADPLLHTRVSARLAVQMLEAGRWALAHAAEIDIPLLLMHGTADPLTSCEASCEFAQRAGSLCTLKTWPGLLHELHWERERDQVVECMIEWFERTN